MSELTSLEEILQDRNAKWQSADDIKLQTKITKKNGFASVDYRTVYKLECACILLVPQTSRAIQFHTYNSHLMAEKANCLANS